ncbi:MAG: hypothetical protein ABL949_01040 [Fimbriimonadaceae bacterium]
MFDANTAGRAPLKAKTINVEANLMAQRLSERRDMANECRRKALTLVIAMMVAAAVLPPSIFWAGSASKLASVTTSKQANLQAQVSSLQQLEATARPALQETQLLDVVRRRADRYLGRSIQFLNLVEPDVALSSMKVSVLAGVMKIDTQANSETYKAYRSFVSKCQETVGIENASARSARPNGLIGAGGYAFDLEYKVDVKL